MSDDRTTELGQKLLDAMNLVDQRFRLMEAAMKDMAAMIDELRTGEVNLASQLQRALIRLEALEARAKGSPSLH